MNQRSSTPRQGKPERLKPLSLASDPVPSISVSSPMSLKTTTPLADCYGGNKPGWVHKPAAPPQQVKNRQLHGGSNYIGEVGPVLIGGDTLRHYAEFRIMPSSDHECGGSLTVSDILLGIIYSPLRKANMWSSGW
jgi:hypothetical protein